MVPHVIATLRVNGAEAYIEDKNSLMREGVLVLLAYIMYSTFMHYANIMLSILISFLPTI